MAVIKSFSGSQHLRVLGHGQEEGMPPANLRKAARKKLAVIHAAHCPRRLANPAGNRLEALVGDRRGQHSVWINDQSRVCFRVADWRAYEIEITEYH